jgi:tetratricopeptide (TPR) repeat protein
VVFQQGCQFVARRAGLKPKHGGSLLVFSVAMIALAIGFGYLSSRRLQAYRDDLSLWGDAVVHQPHDPLVHYNLAIALNKRGERPKAIQHFEQALRLDPDIFQAHYNLALAFEESARPHEAIEHYRATIRLRPEDAASHYNLARLLEDAGDTRSAAEHYRQAVAAQHDFSAAHSNLGLLLLIAGDIENSINHLETALRLEADLTNHVNLMLAYVQANRVAAAIPLAEKALDLARAQGETLLAEKLKGDLEFLRARRSKR